MPIRKICNQIFMEGMERTATCGRRTMASTLAFQAGDDGSIPFARFLTMCGYGLVVERGLPKVKVWVRFPLPALAVFAVA